MKANELQLGDWVLWGEPHSNIDGDYDLEFYPHQIKLDDFFFLSENDWEENEDLEFVKPIQLDEEILKANWFEEYREGVYQLLRYRLINDIASILIEPMKIESRIGNKWYWFSVKYRELNAVSPRITYPFVYVHELQHALRLCGLNELADNFKAE